MSERLNHPVSSSELQRRWAATRDAMAEAGIDVLLVQNHNAENGGWVRWFTDVAPLWVPVTVVFPRDDTMTVVTHGPVGGDFPLTPEGDGMMRGVRRLLTTPAFPPVVYTAEYEADLVVAALAPYAKATIGVVSLAQISYAMLHRIKQSLPDAHFLDASDVVDPVRAIKSAEEQELIRSTARLQDEVMAAALAAIEPGKRERDIVAVARGKAYELGSEAGVYMAASHPVGEPVGIGPAHNQNRVMNEGDVFSILIECDGPGGMYVELGRMAVVGEASAELKEEFKLTLQAQRFTVALMRPGAKATDIWDAYNQYLRDNGRPEERRVHAHAQGCDLMERPLIRFDETMTIEAGMNMACHPAYTHNGVAWWVCDNWLIEADGPGERLHAHPQKIHEL